ncbi:DNA independent RNA polymerase I transcription factor, variant 2, partial [Bonamia ostreae]
LSFEKHILPQEVNFLNFSQFVVFIVTNFHTDYPEKFIRLLIDRIVDKNKTTTTRKNSALYLASYIVRAKFLKPTIIFKSLNVLVELALFYSENTKFCNLPIFYSICESIFHIFIYRHNLLSESGEIEKMSKDLLKIISNEPKILRHCSRNIVIAFSVFSTATNLFDCFSVLLCQFRYFCRNKSNSFRFSDQLKKAGLNQENGPRDFICQNETYFPFDLNKQTFEAKDLKFLFKFEEFYSDDKNLQSDLICVLDQQMNENEGSDDENEAMEESDVMEIHFD